MSTELEKATFNSDVDLVQSLIQSGSVITYGALQNSVMAETKSEARKREQICQILFEAGADPNMPRPEGNAHILDLAAGSVSQKILEMTLNAGAKIDEGWPLHAAVEEDRLDNLKILLAAGADPKKGLSSDYPDELDDMLGMTPLEYAVRIGSKKCAKHLKTLG